MKAKDSLVWYCQPLIISYRRVSLSLHTLVIGHEVWCNSTHLSRYRVRRRKKPAKKYGVLADESIQLNGMNEDEEEEDDLFDQSRRRLIS